MTVFARGHRVITKQEQPVYPQLAGYFGHVMDVSPAVGIDRGPLVWVQFLGRAGVVAVLGCGG